MDQRLLVAPVTLVDDGDQIFDQSAVIVHDRHMVYRDEEAHGVCVLQDEAVGEAVDHGNEVVAVALQARHVYEH